MTAYPRQTLPAGSSFFCSPKHTQDWPDGLSLNPAHTWPSPPCLCSPAFTDLLRLLSPGLALFPAPLPPSRKPLRDPLPAQNCYHSDYQPLLWHLIISLPCVVYTPLCLTKFQSPSENFPPSGTLPTEESEPLLDQTWYGTRTLVPTCSVHWDNVFNPSEPQFSHP